MLHPGGVEARVGLLGEERVDQTAGEGTLALPLVLPLVDPVEAGQRSLGFYSFEVVVVGSFGFLVLLGEHDVADGVDFLQDPHGLAHLDWWHLVVVGWLAVGLQGGG